MAKQALDPSRVFNIDKYRNRFESKRWKYQNYAGAENGEALIFNIYDTSYVGLKGYKHLRNKQSESKTRKRLLSINDRLQ